MRYNSNFSFGIEYKVVELIINSLGSLWSTSDVGYYITMEFSTLMIGLERKYHKSYF